LPPLGSFLILARLPPSEMTFFDSLAPIKYTSVNAKQNLAPHGVQCEAKAIYIL
jgi:hypothetical protein